MLYSLKHFECMLAVTNHHANDLPKTGTPEQAWTKWPKHCEPEVMTSESVPKILQKKKNVTSEYHTKDQKPCEKLQSSSWEWNRWL